MWKLRAMKSMSFTVFNYNATVLLIQPNRTQPMDGPNPCPSLRYTRRFDEFIVRRFVYVFWSPKGELESGTSAGFSLRGSMPPCRPRRRKLWKFDYEMVHFDLNKYVVSIAPFSTPACPDCSQNVTYLNTEHCSFCMLSLFNFSSIFPLGGQLTPFAPCADARGSNT